MKILILIVPVVAAAAVCFAYLVHKHKNSGRRSHETELDRLNILLQNIEAYGKNSDLPKKDGDGR